MNIRTCILTGLAIASMSMNAHAYKVTVAGTGCVPSDGDKSTLVQTYAPGGWLVYNGASRIVTCPIQRTDGTYGTINGGIVAVNQYSTALGCSRLYTTNAGVQVRLDSISIPANSNWATAINFPTVTNLNPAGLQVSYYCQNPSTSGTIQNAIYSVWHEEK
jgi:hypothetical protein